MLTVFIAESPAGVEPRWTAVRSDIMGITATGQSQDDAIRGLYSAIDRHNSLAGERGWVRLEPTTATVEYKVLPDGFNTPFSAVVTTSGSAVLV